MAGRVRQMRDRTFALELDVLEGLERFAVDELDELPDRAIQSLDVRCGAIRLQYAGDLHALLQLRSVLAVYLVLSYPVPRPRALLGHQHLTRLVAALEQVRGLVPPGRYRTIRLSAAGDDSRVLERLKHTLAEQTGLVVTPDEGDLLLRLRRALDVDGWEVLVRLTPRPLATRAWRVCNRPGAPNATLAYAMMRLTHPSPADRVVNLACGSGTLLVERLAFGPARSVVGCDLDHEALLCARRNLEAAGYMGRVRLEPWDATMLPLSSGSVDVVCADLPFGQLTGSHRDNQALYPRLVMEAGRVTAHHGRMVLLTHEVRLLERVLEQHADHWTVMDVVRVRSGGMTPRIYLLRRS